jgi:hypothetical protein
LTWLPNWLYRKTVTFTPGSGAGTNYQFPIKLYYGSGVDGTEVLSGLTAAKIYCDGKCNVDFTDFRPCTGNTTTVLSYWLQSKTDSDNAVFWVKVAADLDSGQTVDVYFGNASAVSLSSQASTFVDVIGGVVGAWNMEDGAGASIVDYSGNSNNGVATAQTTVETGKFVDKNSRGFTVAGAHIDLPIGAINLTGSISVFAWVYNSNPASAWQILANQKTAASKFQWGMSNNEGKLLCFFVADARIYTKFDNVLPTNTWTFITAKYVLNDKVYLYQEANKSTGNNALTGASVFNDALVVGALSDDSLVWQGKVGYFTIINGNLSDAQEANLSANYPDVSLDAGKVLVRKYATTTNPSHSTWGIEESLEVFLKGAFASSKQPSLLGPPAPRPTVPNKFIMLIRDWLEAKTKVAL